MSKLELFKPIKPEFVGQGFGENLVPLYQELGMLGHSGIDYPCPIGKKIYACHDGIVTYAGVDSKEGWGVVVRTLEKFSYKDGEAFFKTIYWHLLKDIPVKAGQEVKAGDLIGYGDTTGAATGSHLHFGLKPIAQGENEWTWANLEQQNGYFGAIDPMPYFNAFYSQDAQLVLGIYRAMVETLKSLISLFKHG